MQLNTISLLLDCICSFCTLTMVLVPFGSPISLRLYLCNLESIHDFLKGKRWSVRISALVFSHKITTNMHPKEYTNQPVVLTVEVEGKLNIPKVCSYAASCPATLVAAQQSLVV